jgi:hypothetical protein
MMSSIGQLVSTPGARDRFDDDFMTASLARHMNGDWGDLDDEDKASNNAALATGGRLLSAYKKGSDTLWIITEADLSVTTLLLPSEY